MHIALDFQSTLGRKTGIGHYTANLLDALRHIAPEHDFTPLDWEHDPVMRLDRRLYWQQIELPRRARRAKAEILHVTGFDAPKFKPCPVVLTVHDLIGALFPQQFPPAARFYWAKWLPRSIRWADAVIADSQCTRADIIRLTGLPAEKITVIPLAVHPAFLQPRNAYAIRKIRREFSLPRRFALYTGTLEPRKGLDTLLRAFASLADNVTHNLVIAGKRGWYTEELLSLVVRYGLERRVKLLGYVPDAELPHLYAAAEVFVFPSRYEGFGLPPLEAMACGTPVVCSNAASLPEVVGEAALLVPPDDPEALAGRLFQVMTSRKLRADLRERGHIQATRFTWEAAARQTLAVYQQVLAKASGKLAMRI